MLFPLDTLKTRLQSQHGFFQSGGFRQLYKGIGPVVLGSAPSGTIYKMLELYQENVLPWVLIKMILLQLLYFLSLMKE